jgi:hypothetical protein
MKEAMEAMAAVVDSHTPMLESHTDVLAAMVMVQQEMHGTLAALTTTIGTASPRAEMALLLTDCRDTITEGIGALHTQGAEVLHALHILQAPPATPRRPTQPLWLAGGVGLVVGVVLMGTTWWAWPDGGYRRFLVGLDAVLVKHHAQLPAPVQDAVAAVYGRYQFQTPGSRQKGK